MKVANKFSRDYCINYDVSKNAKLLT